MKEVLEKIRIPDKNLKLSRKIINTSLIFLLGIILGIFSKWLDNMVETYIWNIRFKKCIFFVWNMDLYCCYHFSI